MASVDDMSYFYLDLMSSWTCATSSSSAPRSAADRRGDATKTCERLSRLVLIGAVGAKFGERDKSDSWTSLPRAQPLGRAVVPQSRGVVRDYESLPEEELTAHGAQPRGDRALRVEPLHVPTQAALALHRIRIPTLFCGARTTASRLSPTAGTTARPYPERNSRRSPKRVISRTWSSPRPWHGG